MSFRDKYKQQKKELLAKHNDTVNNKEVYGSRFTTIFDNKKISNNIPFWFCSEGKHHIDIIPYFVGNLNMYRDKGEVWHYLELWVHRNVGANNDHYVCPTANLKIKKPCPICEYQSRMKKEGKLSKDEIKELYPRRRVVYFIWCHDNEKEEAKGLQIWEVAHWFMQDKLDELIESPKGGGILHYFDPDKGKTISFKRRGSGQGNTEFLAHTFIDREQSIPDEILDKTFPLEDIIKIASYEEIELSFFGEKAKEKEKEVPKKEEKETDNEEIKKEKEVPKKEAKETDNEEIKKEEEAPKKEAKETKDSKCPHGYMFGADTDEKNECMDCSIWDDCLEAKEDDIPF